MIGLFVMAAVIGTGNVLPPAQRSPIFITGDQLATMCAAKDTLGCVRYIEGVSDTYVILHNASSYGNACIPVPIIIEDERRIVVTFMKAHPEALHMTAAALVGGALSNAYPCAK